MGKIRFRASRQFWKVGVPRLTMGGNGPARRGWTRIRPVTVLLAASSLAVGIVAIPTVAQAAVSPTVVSLTFDDSNADQMTALASLQANGLNGTFYTITGSIGSPNYLTLDQLHTIYSDGDEIGGHTVNHPDLTLETTDEAQRQVCDARNQLLTWGFPQTSFAYPYAAENATVEGIVKACGYNSARSLGDVLTQEGGDPGVYAETTPPENAYALRAPDEVDSTWTLADLENTVTNAENNGGGWDILTFHHICDSGAVNCDPTVSITPELFDQFTTWLAAHIASTPTTTVKTVDQVVGGTDAGPVTAPAPPAVAGAITNSSLETAVTPGVPNCWSAYNYGNNTPSYAETTDAHTGTVAETITMTGYSDGDAKILPTFDTGGCTPGATAGHTYTLGAWYKSTVDTQFEVYARNAEGGFDYLTASPWFAPATTYTQATWTTPVIPAGVTGISFGLNIFSNGTLTTDDYSDVDAAPAAPVFTADTPPATATVGTAYSYTYAASGSPAPTFAVSSGTLPAGLTLNATTGVLSGTPTAVGPGSFTVTASNGTTPDAVGPSTTITVAAAPAAPAFTADTPPATATVGTPYTYTYTASGSPAPTFAVTSGGSLPAGLTLNSTTGVLSGTPTAVGPSTFTVTATNGVSPDAVGPSTTITVAAAPAAPAFTADTPPATATVGTAYSYTYTATGNPAPTFAVTSGGTLPAGLTLNSTTGVLSGTPTTAGSATFTVTATNGVSPDAVGPSTTITVAAAPAAPAFTADTPPATATVGTAYSYTYKATGNPAPTFAVTTGGSLPAGLTLNSTTGVLSGTPTAVGSATFTVTASNGVSPNAVGPSTTITVGAANAAPVFTANTPPATATVGTAYSYTYKATGNPAPTFAVASGSLPAGLTLNSATGVLAGTPTTAGASTFTVRASNGVGTAPVSPSTTITVSPASTAPVFTANTPPATATVGTAYSYTYKATGNPAPTFAVASGGLPTGLTLNSTTGVLSGTPTAAGAFTFTVRASNGVGTAPVSPSTTITVSVAKIAPAFTADTPPATATVGTAYSYTYTASGSPAPTFAIASGGLPTGLTLNSAGVLSGTPTAAGAWTFTVRASNGVGTAPVTPSTKITVSVAKIAPVFTADTPPATAAIGTAYSYTYKATGSPAPTFALASGGLPTGLTLNATTGVLSGKPTALGTWTFAVRASNGVGTAPVGPSTKIKVSAAQAAAFTADTPTATAAVGTAYSYTYKATGSPAPTFTVATGKLPAGLTLDPTTGVLSGKPTTAGAFDFTVRASNGVGTAPVSPAIPDPAARTSASLASASASPVLVGYPVVVSPAIAKDGDQPRIVGSV